jgi:hypothetical protein
LQNISEFFKATNGKLISKTGTSVLSGLSTEGKIILPVEKSNEKRENHMRQLYRRSNLINAAREGDEEAIESLTIEDMDLYSMLSRRVENEDLLSIVETSLMPYGVESDQYAVIGEIFDISYAKNMITGETIVILSVNSKDIIYDICINEKDLLGEPRVGRRFKGRVWLQGIVKY